MDLGDVVDDRDRLANAHRLPGVLEMSDEIAEIAERRELATKQKGILTLADKNDAGMPLSLRQIKCHIDSSGYRSRKW